KNYATPEGWERHRERITQMYMEKTLKEVLEIMEQDHNFFATERMYKARLKEWGVTK
ncbi:Clr5 domain-containing protein, partial [Diaporthe sp. PMI_573]